LEVEVFADGFSGVVAPIGDLTIELGQYQIDCDLINFAITVGIYGLNVYWELDSLEHWDYHAAARASLPNAGRHNRIK
jgi:hypothetical protein